MKNFIEKGDALTLTAPVGGVVSDTPYLVGVTVVIATETVAAGLPFVGIICGCVDVPKLAEEAWSEGLKVCWDDVAKVFTATAGGNTLAGVAVSPIVQRTVTLASTALAADLAIVGLTLQVLDWATLAGGVAPTVTVTVDGVATVLTEGTEWTAAVSDEATAGSLASAIDGLAGVECAAPGADIVTVIPTTGSGASSAIGRVRLDGAARA